MKKPIFKKTFLPGSAFIMVFVITALLALIGLIFLLTSRVDKLSTSAIEQNKQLDAAVDTVIAQISQQLVVDSPGVTGQEYYDYPDPCNLWLTNLEPYTADGTNYFWRRFSDIYNRFGFVNIPIPAEIIDDYQPPEDVSETALADADGDGVSDSVWIEIPDMNASKGGPVFAAVRIVDNSAMLNVNTDYKFVPFGYDVPASEIDGSSQLQLNFAGLSQRGVLNGTLSEAAAKLHLWRSNGDPNTALSNYERNVIWRYVNSVSGYTPFDISDELELRNRFLIKNLDVSTRLKDLWTNTFKVGEWTPFDSNYPGWCNAVNLNNLDTYDFRHIATINNIDRIIDPTGDRMLNVKKIPEVDIEGQPPAQWIYSKKLLPCLSADDPDYNRKQAEFAQAAANIKDYSDADTVVTTVLDLNSNSHYGFERPEIHISEIVYGYTYIDTNNPGRTYKEAKYIDDPNIPYFLHRSYAIEIHNNFNKNDEFYDWRLVIESTEFDAEIPIDIDLFQTRGGRYYVAIYEDPNAAISDLVEFSDSPDDGARGVDPNVILRWSDIWGRDPNGNWVIANAYDVFFGTDKDSVADATALDDPNNVWMGRTRGHLFDPCDLNPWDEDGTDPMEPLGTTFYWRIAGVNDIDGNPATIDDNDVIIDNGKPPWEFTTWFVEPNSIVDWIDVNSPDIFTPSSFIRLERRVRNEWEDRYIIVDLIGPSGELDANAIPGWLFDINDADINLRTHSFQRDLSSMGRLKRLWNYDRTHYSALFPSLGHRNDFSWPTELPLLQSRHHSLNNIGELGSIFKKSTYYEVPVWTDRIQRYYKEFDEYNALGERIGIGVKLDLTVPEVQRLCNFLTVMDPDNHGHDVSETRIKGRVNINTAPWFVLAQLPWVSTRTSLTLDYDLAKAIAAYRDKISLPPDLDYTTRAGLPGFENIGQLNNVVHSRLEASIDYFGRDNEDQRGYPDLSTSRRTKVDGYPDDLEERDLIFARISDLVTVRSDVFTAYILVRLGSDGPQKRVMAILDRSEVTPYGGKVKLLKLYEVPDAR